jgi:hypothetical protein
VGKAFAAGAWSWPLPPKDIAGLKRILSSTFPEDGQSSHSLAVSFKPTAFFRRRHDANESLDYRPWIL